MSLVEILPDIQSLPRADKLRLIQFLAQELADAEIVSGRLPDCFTSSTSKLRVVMNDAPRSRVAHRVDFAASVMFAHHPSQNIAKADTLIAHSR
jgi:hypothetical protein